MLSGSQKVNWTMPDPPSGVTLQNVFIGPDPGGMGLQVALAEVSSNPSRELLAALHSARKGRRNFHLVVAAICAEQMYIFGPDENAQVLVVPKAQGLRQLQSALTEPDSLAAYTRLGHLRRALDTTQIAGITNNGLFANYHLRMNVPSRSDWMDCGSRAQPWLALRGGRLIQALGFTSQRTAGNALILTGLTAASHAVAVLLDESEQFDGTSPRFQLSPVAWGLNVAARQGVPWLIVLRQDQIRLYPAKDGVGVGQKGQVETFFEIDLAAIDDAYAALLKLVFSASALEPNGSTQQLLEASSKYAANLSTRLRDRIYDHVVPDLARAVAAQLPAMGLGRDSEGLSTAYRVTLRLLFRLLFQAYAEDRGLLPSGRNERYDSNSLKTIARRELRTPLNEYSTTAKTLWLDLIQVWNAIDEGNPQWDVPAYNGGLFGTDPFLHPEGALIEKLVLTDSVLGPVLHRLLIDTESEDGVPGPVDFRSLSVREFGTIYEGLLESNLSIAQSNLKTDKKGSWIPAKVGDAIEAETGDVYFHSASGERKATGSYFTPSFVVDHLINNSLDPALDVHLQKIKQNLEDGDEAGATRNFFDFRVADLAMGSGHFLVAAIDRIESKMRSFLADPSNQVPGVTAELFRLAEAAKTALGKDETAIADVEPTALLRRQIARRCIYGLDINPLAVELSRLAIWIHTFVPGLPMSSLDHSLVCANSLTGIGTIDEALDALEPGRDGIQSSFLSNVITENLAAAKEVLIDLANASEANKQEVRAAAAASLRARSAALPAKRLLDAAVAARVGVFDPRMITSVAQVEIMSATTPVVNLVDSLKPAHMPFLFPEVFLRSNPGFDVILGNPPWEELVYEEIKFWTLRNPGLRGQLIANQLEIVADLRASQPDAYRDMQKEMDSTNAYRKILMSGPYIGMGSGHADLYKAFNWRYIQLVRDGGYVGVVLPRGALTAAGSSDWRREVMHFGHFVATVFLINTNGWIFPSVHGQYSIALTIIQKGKSGKTVLAGPFGALDSFADFEEKAPVGELAGADVLKWSETAAFPLLPSPQSVDLFLALRRHPSLGDSKYSDFEFAPVQGDFNQTTDRELVFLGDESKGDMIAYKGASFNLWNSNTGEVLGSASSDVVGPAFQRRMERARKLSSSAFFGRQPDKQGKTGLHISRHELLFG
jgi:hypothetical protein